MFFAHLPMFHVEHMRILLIFSISFLLFGCDRPDPQPQLKDPIYLDIQSEITSLQQSLDSETKTLQEHLKTLAEVVPQTGQNKYAQKRVDESKALLNKISQELEYQKLKLQAQEKKARFDYKKAFESKEVWPNPSEWSEYQTEKRFRNAKKTWDVESRLKELSSGNEKETVEHH